MAVLEIIGVRGNILDRTKVRQTLSGFLVIDLGTDGVTFGRAETPGARREHTTWVRISDPSVGVEHASVVNHQGAWRLTDTGSPHGTFLNGRQIRDDASLN